MTSPSIIQRSFEIMIIQTYNFVLHNIYLPSYNSWHICLCLTLWCSFLCFALQINSYERETCFWKLEDGKGGLYVLCFLSFPGGNAVSPFPDLFAKCFRNNEQFIFYLIFPHFFANIFLLNFITHLTKEHNIQFNTNITYSTPPPHNNPGSRWCGGDAFM